MARTDSSFAFGVPIFAGGNIIRGVGWNKSSAVAEMGDRLATIDMGRKVGRGCYAPFCGAELGPHLTQCGMGDAYLHTKWNLDPSNRLAIVHQRHRQRDRQTQRSDSIGRTVLQTVVQTTVA